MTMPHAESSHPLRLRRILADGSALEASDLVAVEEPLEIRVRGKALAVTMRTPGHDRELAAGFLLAEGVVRTPDEIVGIEPCRMGAHAGNVINVFLAGGCAPEDALWQRRGVISTSCGMCGKASIEAVQHKFAPLDAPLAASSNRHGSGDTLRVDSSVLASLPDRLRSAQTTFDATGGLHGIGLFDRQGNLVVAREDIGRHNAVDKVLGFGFLNGLLPWDNHLLLVSGRASFEIMQKALAARIPVVAAVSAPSSLAVSFAEENGQTLVGFLRGGAMNVYAGGERVVKP